MYSSRKRRRSDTAYRKFLPECGRVAGAGLYGFVTKSGALLRGLLLLRREVGGIRATVLLSLADFIIVVFPCYLLAAARDATAVVAFDMFYKVTRFAVLSYLIGAETVLPHQTRAVHNDDAVALARATAKGFVVGLLPMTSGIIAIAMFGDGIFSLILSQSGIVSPVMRIAHLRDATSRKLALHGPVVLPSGACGFRRKPSA